MVFKPISVLNNKPARIVREILVRPMKQSGIDLFGHWIKSQTWSEVFDVETVDEKAEVFQNMLLEKLEQFLPAKLRRISSDDQPFCTEEMKRLKRLKSREYSKNRRSLKWRDLSKKYDRTVQLAKRNYYKNVIKDLKTSKIVVLKIKKIMFI